MKLLGLGLDTHLLVTAAADWINGTGKASAEEPGWSLVDMILRRELIAVYSVVGFIILVSACIFWKKAKRFVARLSCEQFLLLIDRVIYATRNQITEKSKALRLKELMQDKYFFYLFTMYFRTAETTTDELNVKVAKISFTMLTSGIS